MASNTLAQVPTRQISIPLAFGILFVPIVFSWFVLRKGYSSLARVVALSWLLCFFVFAFLQEPDETGPKVTSAEPTRTAKAASAAAVVATPTTTTADSTPTSSERKLKRLYGQLQGFRRDQAFLDVGFDLCCRYNAWLQDVRRLRARSSSMTINGQRVVTGELETLAFQYMRNGGRSTEMASTFERQFEYALYPPKPLPGRGIVVEDTRGCRNFELVAQFFRLSEEGAYAASDAVLYGPGCERVGVGTRIGPVLARKSYRYRSGETSDHVLVQLPNGRKVWLWDGEIEFH